MKAALIQLNAGEDKEANLKKAVSFIKKAARARARFILLPEVFTFRGKTSRITHATPEKIPGPTSKALCALAKKHKIFILAGSMHEKTPLKNKFYNTSFLINPHGKIIAKYRKIHLFRANIGNKKISEEKIFLKGNSSAVADIDGFHVGLSICFDLRFPDLYQNYFKKGVDVLCVPSAFTQATGKVHWEPLLRARAIENLAYVLAPNQVGHDSKGMTTYGHSMAVSPWGEVLAQASNRREEIIYVTLNKEEILRRRRQIII